MSSLSRSEMLVHWTGSNLATPNSFVERLRSLYKNGLFYVELKVDTLRGFGSNDRELPSMPSVCFTEMRLRDAHRFSIRYGKLGIVFHRTYLMRQGGANPVFYLQSDNNGIVNTIVARLSERASGNFSRLHDSCYSDQFENFDLKFALSFCKPMSDPGDQQLSYFEEHEWRMVVHPGWPTDGSQLPAEYASCESSPSGRAFRFQHKDVQAIVFPDRQTRQVAMADETMREYFKDHIPQMIDLDLCGNV